MQGSSGTGPQPQPTQAEPSTWKYLSEKAQQVSAPLPTRRRSVGPDPAAAAHGSDGRQGPGLDGDGIRLLEVDGTRVHFEQTWTLHEVSGQLAEEIDYALKDGCMPSTIAMR